MPDINERDIYMTLVKEATDDERLFIDSETC